MAERIVLFGGTFDPVHHGHLIVARALAEQRGVERVTLVPAAAPPHKGGVWASAGDRLAMLQAAVAGEALFDICDVELARTGPSYTYDTLVELRRRRGPRALLHWVIGADMLEDLPSWHRAGEVLEMAEIIIVARAPWQERLEEILSGIGRSFGAAQIEKLRSSVVPTPLIDISSSEIRRRVAEGRSVRFLVPEAVRAYIQDHGLYAAGGR